MQEKDITYRIADEVFERFPGYVRGVVIAHGVENSESPVDLVTLLRAEEAALRDRLSTEELARHPRMESWREAYRAFGAKPAKFRPSMEAMARRVLKGQEIPSISKLVDIGNVMSLRYLVPAGGHAIDVLTEDMLLRPATGNEQFTAFGSDQVENPLPGEIILAEGDIVLTRRWTWRQAKHTLIMPSSTAIELNVDGLPPVEIQEIEEACHEAGELIQRFCGGSIRYEIMSKEKSFVRF